MIFLARELLQPSVLILKLQIFQSNFPSHHVLINQGLIEIITVNKRHACTDNSPDKNLFNVFKM